MTHYHFRIDYYRQGRIIECGFENNDYTKEQVEFLAANYMKQEGYESFKVNEIAEAV
jgi:hypothetical protein